VAGCAGRPPGSRIGIGRPWRENLLRGFYRRTASNDLQLSAKRATVTRPFSQYSAGLRRVEILTEHQPPSRSMVFAEGGREVNRPWERVGEIMTARKSGIGAPQPTRSTSVFAAHIGEIGAHVGWTRRRMRPFGIIPTRS